MVRNVVRSAAVGIQRAVVAAAAAAIVLTLAGRAPAESGNWTGSTSAVWQANANWTGLTFPTSRFQYATFSGAGNGFTTIDVGAGLSVDAVIFDTASAAAYTIGSGGAGAQTLTLRTERGLIWMTSSVANNQVFNANIVSNAPSTVNVIQDSTTNSLTFAGGISGAGTSGASTFAVYGAGDTIISGVMANGSGTATMALTKGGTGTLTLSNNNTYTGTTTVNGGTLTLTGSLSSSTLSPLMFGSTGAFNLDNIGDSVATSQAMGALTFSAGEGTVKTTRTEDYNEAITFSSLSTRVAGATGNFVNGGGVNGAGNGFVITGKAAGFLDKGVFYGGDNYAWYDAGGFIRPISYSGTPDSGAATSEAAESLASATHQEITGAISAQNTAIFTTFKINGASDLTLAGGQTVTVDSILKAGNNAAAISGGTGIRAASNAELMIRTDRASDALTISTPILANGANALTKSGAGTVTLNAANTYTGTTTVNAGTLAYGVNNAIAAGAVTINGGTLDMATYSDTVGAVTLTAGSITGTGTLTGTSYTMNNPGATSVSAVLGGTGGLTKTGLGTLTLSNNANTYSGVTTITAGVVTVSSLKNGGVASSIGQSSSAAANLIFNGNTRWSTLRYVGQGDDTDRLFHIEAYGGATIESSGTGALKFTNVGSVDITGVNYPTWLELAGSNSDDNTFNLILPQAKTGTCFLKSGTGKWILTGASTYAGTGDVFRPYEGVTMIKGGTLGVTWLANGGVASPLGAASNAAAKLVLDGGTLQYLGSGTSSGTTDRLFTLGVGTTGGALDASGAAGFPMVFTNTGALAFTGTGARTLTLTGTNTDANRLAAAIANQSTNATSLVKTGPGAWTLSGASTYTGSTAVSQGTLNLTGSLGNTNVTVASGAFLGGEATIGTTTGGSLAFSDGATLRVNGNTAGAMTVGSGSSGNLTLEGTINVVLDAVPATVGIGSTIRLLNYNGILTGEATNLALVGSANYRNPIFSTATAKQVNLTIDTQSLTWQGTTDGKWDINGTANWNSPGEKFYQGDAVTFDDSATTKDVTLDATVLPASVTFTNTAGNDYTLSGTGGIAGAVVLTKNGTGAVTLGTANSYTGTTTISAGTLKLGAAGDAANTPLGTTAAGTSVAAGAALDLNGFSLGTTEALTLNGTGVSGNGALTNSSSTAATYKGPITLGSASSIVSATGDINLSSTATISGATLGLTLGGVGANSSVASVIGTTTGTLTKEGTGIWALSAANTYTGATTVSGGPLKLANQLAVQSSTLTMNGGSLAFDSSVSGNAFTFGGLAASTSGAGYDIVLENNAGTPAAVALTVGGNNANTTYAGELSGAGSLTKTGTGVLTLSGNNVYTGITTVSNGVLRADEGAGLADSRLDLGGGVLETSGTFRRAPSTDPDSVRVLAGNSGFSAWGNPLIVDLDSTSEIPGPTLAWGTNASFAPTTLVLNAASADSALDFKNAIDLKSTTTAVTRTIQVNANTATLSGILSNSNITNGGAGLTKTGNGTLILNAANSYTGITTISAGVLSASKLADAGSTSSIGAYAATGAAGLVLGGGTLQYTGSSMETAITRGFTLSAASTIDISPASTTLMLGNSSLGAFTLNVIGGAGSSLSLESTTVTGNATFAPNVPLTLASLTGTNQTVTFGGTSTSTVTGATTFSDTATITANGTLSLATIVETATAAKTITLSGTGTGSVSGVISQNGANALAITKTGAGTWTLSGANTYTGVTTINQGVVEVTTLADGGVASSLGQSSNTAANLVFHGNNVVATLRYIGSGATSGTTDRLFTLHPNHGGVDYSVTPTLDASGAEGSPMVFNNTDRLVAGGSQNRNTITLTLTGTNTDDNTLASAIVQQRMGQTSGDGSTAVMKSGSGTWVLSGDNVYRAATTINGGVLKVTKLAAAAPLSMSMTTTAGSPIVTVASTAGLSAGMTIDFSTYTSYDTGIIPSGTKIASVDTATQFTLETGTGITAGTATGYVGVANSLGWGPDTATHLVLNGGTLQYIGSGANGTSNRLFTLGTGATAGTLNASGAAGSPFVLSNTGSMATTGTGTRTLTLTGTNTDDNTLTPVIVNQSSNATSLVKSGAGKWVLSGVNTYTGTTTVTGGTLVIGSTGRINSTSGVTIDGSGAVLQYDSSTALTKPVIFGASGGTFLYNESTTGYTGGPLSVGTGATLGGTGKIAGAVTIDVGGSIAPGANGLGTLTIGGDLTINGSYNWEMDGTADGHYDKLVLGASTTYSQGAAAQLVLNYIGETPWSTAFADLPIFSSSGGALQAFTNITANNFASGTFTTSYEDGDLLLSYVPGITATFSGTSTWTATTSPAAWGTGANWTDPAEGGIHTAPGSAPIPPRQIAQFKGKLGVGAQTIQLSGANPLLNAISFAPDSGNETAYTIDTAGGGKITLQTQDGVLPTISVSGTSLNTIDVPVTLENATEISTLASGSQLEISQTIDGAGTLTKTGEGSLTLTGANGYGGTVVTGGTLTIGSAGALPAGKSLSIGSGGTLILGGGMAMGQAASTQATEPVPEPGTLALLAIAALAGVMIWRRRR